LIEVELTREEYAIAVVYGTLQGSLHSHLRDRTGRRPRGYAQRIESTAAELALAKYLGLPFEIRFNTGKGDVGEIEVRWAQEERYGLIVRPDDPPDPPYVLVTGRAGLYHLQGWLYGHEAMRPEWSRSPNGRPPVFIAPQAALHALETLPGDRDEHLTERLFEL
jgi:hypothetical protein